MKMFQRIVAACGLACLCGCPQGPTGVPTANFTYTPDHGPKTLSVTFTDTSTPGDSPITAWAWDFGDDGTSTEQNPVHDYTANGVYDVKLTVTNAQGSNATLKSEVIVVGTVWAAVDGFAGDDECVGVSTAGSTNLVFVSTVTQDGRTDTDIQLQRRDAKGAIIWTKYFGGEADDTAGGVTYESGEIVLCGTTKSFGLGGTDAYVVRVDGDGVALWAKTFGTAQNDAAEKVAAVSGGFLVAGTATPPSRALPDFYLFKIDNDGKQLWSKTYGLANSRETLHGMRDVAAGILLVGEQANSTVDMFAVLTDDSGKETWSGSYGETVTGNNRAYDGYQQGDNFVLIGTGYNKSSITGYDIMMQKMDKDGKKVSAVYAGSVGSDEGVAVGTNSGNYIVAGSTTAATAGGRDVYLVSLKADGTKNWTQVFGGVGDDRAFAMTFAAGDIVLGGSTESFGAGATDNYLLRTTITGNGVSNPDPAL